MEEGMSTGQEAEQAGRQEPPTPDSSGGAPGAATRPRGLPSKTDQLPPFRVLLHNDDLNEMQYVVRTIIELTRLDSGRAMKIMMTAHTRGAALVLVTHKERAELFRDQFASKRLKVTIEPAD